MRIRTYALAAAVVAASTTALTLAPTATAAPAVTGELKGDFNGDGYGDLAFAAPYANVDGKGMAGYVVVMYGGENGVDATDPDAATVISQASAGVPGTPEAEDTFGSALAVADFNGDGYTDLAVGAPGEDVDADVDGGTVAILWGSSSGVAGGTTVKDPAVSGHDAYGQLLTAGDFDGDGTQDLATGASNASVYVIKGGFTKAGATGGSVKVTAPNGLPYGPDALTSGDVNQDGLADLVVTGRVDMIQDDPGTTRSTGWYYAGATTGIGSVAPTVLPGGTSATVGDIDGDGHGDIVLGNTFFTDDDLSGSLGGRVTVVPGSADGPDTAAATTLTQDSPGIPGADEERDGFGGSVSVGDLDGDGYGDLAVGVTFEDITSGTTTLEDTGSTVLMYGSADGLTTTGARTLSQASSGVPGTAEAMDYFGAEVLLTDVNGDGNADYTVGATFENEGRGAVTAMLSDGTGVSTTGADGFGPGAFGLSSGYSAFGAHLIG